MAKTLLFEEQDVAGFAYDSSFGAYTPGFVSPAAFTLVAGESYTVLWDGAEYVCTAFSYEYSSMAMVAIGDGTPFGLPGNGEPFLLNYNAQYDNTQIFASSDDVSHRVAIWEGVDLGIMLKTPGSEYAPYRGADKGINVLMEDGTEKIYVDSDGVPELAERSVTLDFAGVEEMVIAPVEGQAFSLVRIPKPANLIPGCIQKGITIAGVDGELEVGSGGGEIVSKEFFYSAASNGVKPTITHGLGVVPDIILGYNVTFNAGYAFLKTGRSAAFGAAQKWPTNLEIVRNSSNLSTNSTINHIDDTDSSAPIYNANEQTITIGGTGLSSGYWLFYVIGGLT